MKSLNEMDLEEWELLPDEGFLEISDNGSQKIYTRKDSSSSSPSSSSSSSSSDIRMNYFICPPETGRRHHHHHHHCLLPVPIDLQSQQTPVDVKIKSVSAGDQEPEVSQVFFKKMKETEFVDMKLDSPKSGSSCGGIMPRKDFQFGENVGINTTCEEAADEDEEGGVVNIWKWIGAGICSFGVAAATFCIVRLIVKQKQKLRFHIYTNDDKRIKQVVHHASKLNEAVPAA